MVKILLQGIRVKTLVAGIIPPLLAQALAFKIYHQLEYIITLQCLALAVFIQMATNFYNDAVDFKKGADADRDGPTRVSNEQNLKYVFMFGHLFLLAAFLTGIPLVLEGGPFFIFLGLVSLYFAYGYTGGPFALAYYAMGELFVFLFFGLVATLGSYYLILNKIDIDAFLLACMIGFLSCSLIAINNLRDRDKDKLVNKNTLATKMSKYKFIKIIECFIFLPYLFLFYFVCFVDLHLVPALLSIGLAHKIRFILHHYNESNELNKALELSGKHMLIFSLLFGLSLIWS